MTVEYHSFELAPDTPVEQAPRPLTASVDSGRLQRCEWVRRRTEELAADPDYREVLAAEGDTWPLLAALADRADAETDGSKGVRFSFRGDLGTSRFVMVDSRNGRILDDGAHLMLGESEFRWVEDQVRDRSTGSRSPGAGGRVDAVGYDDVG